MITLCIIQTLSFVLYQSSFPMIKVTGHCYKYISCFYRQFIFDKKETILKNVIYGQLSQENFFLIKKIFFCLKIFTILELCLFIFNYSPNISNRNKIIFVNNKNIYLVKSKPL